MALDARTLGLTLSCFEDQLAEKGGFANKRRPDPPGSCLNPFPEFQMKTRLLIVGLLVAMLGGCIVVPEHAYHPARVYVY